MEIVKKAEEALKELRKEWENLSFRAGDLENQILTLQKTKTSLLSEISACEAKKNLAGQEAQEAYQKAMAMAETNVRKSEEILAQAKAERAKVQAELSKTQYLQKEYERAREVCEAEKAAFEGKRVILEEKLQKLEEMKSAL